MLLRPPSDGVPDYVARVEEITKERNDVKVRTRWYYRPEESLGGRRNFHGEKEVFLSDHYDVCSVDAIIGPCTVHSFKNYVKLDSVEAEDYFCRFEYRASTGTFKPDYVAVYVWTRSPCSQPGDLTVLTPERLDVLPFLPYAHDMCSVASFVVLSAPSAAGRRQGPAGAHAPEGTFLPLPGGLALLPTRYCICEMPYNPDDLMVQCDSCKDW